MVVMRWPDTGSKGNASTSTARDVGTKRIVELGAGAIMLLSIQWGIFCVLDPTFRPGPLLSRP